MTDTDRPVGPRRSYRAGRIVDGASLDESPVVAPEGTGGSGAFLLVGGGGGSGRLDTPFHRLQGGDAEGSSRPSAAP